MTDSLATAANTGTFDPFPTRIIADAVTDLLEPAQPVVPNGFMSMGLAPELLQAVQDLGFIEPTLVQNKTIPLAMQHDDSQQPGTVRFNDLMVSSQTGSGKTAAFLLPVLHTLLRQQERATAQERADFEKARAAAAASGAPAPKRPRRKDSISPRHFKAASPGALVLCPTRELAQQVAQDAIDLVRHCHGLRIANVVGGMPYQLQIARLQNANLVVATPGRLLDLQRSMQIKLEQVQFLVVDEADRMLDLGFADDLAEINQLTIARQQTMMFSATLAPRIQQLAQRVMREPQRIQIDSPQQKHQNIKQVLFWADHTQHKRKLLDHWLREPSLEQAIVFSSTQIECDGLAADLQQDGFSAVALHGALSQSIRNRRLQAFRDGMVQILVATDVAARGLDVPNISHIFNFGLPMKPEDYTHRIGRTGRAGRDGVAVTLAEMRDRRRIFDIEAFTRQPFVAETIPGLEPQQRFSAPARQRPDFAARNGGGGGGRGRPARGRDERNNNVQPAWAAERDNGAGGRSRSPARGVSFGQPFVPRPAPFVPAGDFESRSGHRFEGHSGPGFGRGSGQTLHATPASGYAKTGGKPAGGGKVFVPRDAKKRAAAHGR